MCIDTCQPMRSKKNDIHVIKKSGHNMLFQVMFIPWVGWEVFNSHIFYHYSFFFSKSRHQFDCQQMFLYIYFRYWKYVLEYFTVPCRIVIIFTSKKNLSNFDYK